MISLIKEGMRCYISQSPTKVMKSFENKKKAHSSHSTGGERRVGYCLFMRLGHLAREKNNTSNIFSKIKYEEENHCDVFVSWKIFEFSNFQDLHGYIKYLLATKTKNYLSVEFFKFFLRYHRLFTYFSTHEGTFWGAIHELSFGIHHCEAPDERQTTRCQQSCNVESSNLQV